MVARDLIEVLETVLMKNSVLQLNQVVPKSSPSLRFCFSRASCEFVVLFFNSDGVVVHLPNKIRL